MSKIRESAKGEECQVRIPGVCNGDSETVVFAHIGGGGMGTKQQDSEGAYCCSACHDVVDARVKVQYTENGASPIILTAELIKLYHHEGAMRTRKILIEKGLLILK